MKPWLRNTDSSSRLACSAFVCNALSRRLRESSSVASISSSRGTTNSAAAEGVAALEQGDLPLDECLAKYETGVKALRTCRQILDEAEKKIEMLTKDESGALKAKPFEPEIEADEEEKK